MVLNLQGIVEIERSRQISLASLIYFLSSDDASWITGEVVTIDGGFLL